MIRRHCKLPKSGVHCVRALTAIAPVSATFMYEISRLNQALASKAGVVLGLLKTFSFPYDLMPKKYGG